MEYDYHHHEEEFFRKQDAEARRKLREKLEAKAAADAATSSGDGEMNQLSELGLNAEKAKVLHLLPLVEVSWADGAVRRSERAAVLHAAKSHGVEPDSEGGQFLAALLEEKPSDELFAFVRKHLHRLLKERGVKPSNLLEECRDIAEAAGGFFGFGPNVDEDEAAVIAQLEQQLKEASSSHLDGVNGS